MAVCEMCGKETSLIEADVEGVSLKVCSTCAKYGSVKRKKASPHHYRRKSRRDALPDVTIVSNYSQLLRQEREKRGMTHEQFAHLLNERESLVSKWEQGTMALNVSVARKLGKILNVSFIKKIAQETPENKVQQSKKANGELTIGDFIKVRKR